MTRELFGYSETELQRSFVMSYMWSKQRYNFIAPNCYLNWGDFTEFDLLCIRRSGFIDEVEIKRTVSDFRADFKKRGKYHLKKHELLEAGKTPANYFWFLMTDELASKVSAEIPDHAGIYVLRHGFIVELKKAPRLHTSKITNTTRVHLGEKMMHRYWRQVQASYDRRERNGKSKAQKSEIKQGQEEVQACGHAGTLQI